MKTDSKIDTRAVCFFAGSVSRAIPISRPTIGISTIISACIVSISTLLAVVMGASCGFPHLGQEGAAEEI